MVYIVKLHPPGDGFIGQYIVLLLALFLTLLSSSVVRADCIDDPTAACLVELAVAEVDKARDTDEFKLNGNTLLSHLGTTQAAIGDIAGAARTGSQIGAERELDIHGAPVLDIPAQELLLFVEDVLIKKRPSSADLTPIRDAAQALLTAATALPLSQRASSTEGRAVHILALIGYADEARSALDNAIRRFSKAIEAGDKNILPAADDLLSAAIALRDLDVARKIVGMISTEEMSKPGVSPDSPRWTNRSAQNTLNVAAAQQTPNSQDAELMDSIQDLIRVAKIKSSGVAEAMKRSLEGQSASDTLNAVLAERLKEIGQSAEFYADDLDNLKGGIALAFLAAGDTRSAEALLTEISDTGRAQVIIQLATVRVKKGEIEEAIRLLGEAKQALAAEQNPARLVDFNVGIALVLLTLNDHDGAEAAIDKALASLEGIDDPMLQLEEGAGVAAIQWKLNHPEQAIATLEKVTGGNPGDLVLGRILAAGFLAKQGYFADAKTVVSQALRDASKTGPSGPLDLAFLYSEAAKTLITGARHKP